VTHAPKLLARKVVAITGGARGIGRATATALQRTGALVAIGDLDQALTERVASEIGPGCVGLRLDVSDRTSFEDFLNETETRLGGSIDVLVNNAGVFLVSLYADETPAASDRMVDVNIRGTMTGTQLAVQRMVPRRAGHIVNVASVAGKAAFPGAATYTATKFAIVGLSEAVRMELRGTGVELSCVLPGLVDTDMAVGLALPPGIKPNRPDDVAAAIVGALERPRFEVYVPRAFGIVVGSNGLMPRAARERLGHLLKADTPLSADAGLRASYEARIHDDAVAAPRVSER
jgi:NADP-dependent 3-hydroxy acid dehydrogenase YdfG